MNKATGLNVCTLICLLALAKYAFAEGPMESGFLDDYSRLQPAEADWVDYIYISDGFRERLAEARTLT
jgi:hypothetical protein